MDRDLQKFIPCLEFYLEDCLARGESGGTVNGKRSNLGFFIRWALGEDISGPGELRLIHLEAYRRNLFQFRQPHSGRPLTIGTHRNRLTAVKMFLKRLFYLEVIPENPAVLFELPGVSKTLPRGHLTASEVERVLLQTVIHGRQGIRDRAVLEAFYASGIRRMELAHLTMADLDPGKQLLTIYQGKGRKDRRVPVAQRTVDWVAIYLKDIRPELATVESGTTLFLDNEGLAFRGHQLTRMASKYARKAGLKKSGACNLFRHTTATLMHENGADIRHIQEMLGHADISTTQVYTHVVLKHLREVYARTHPAALE